MKLETQDRVLGYIIEVSKHPGLTPEHVKTALDQGLTPDCFKAFDPDSGTLIDTPRSRIASMALDFYHENHAPVTDRILETSLQEQPLQPDDLADYLQVLGNVYHSRNGGGEPLHPTNITHLSRRVVSDFKELEFISNVRSWQNCKDPEKKADIIRQAATRYTTDPSNLSEEKTIELNKAIENDILKYEKVKAEGLSKSRVLTGFSTFDDDTLGLHPTESLVVSARPNTGKSMMIMWLLLQNYRRHLNVALANIQDAYEVQRHRLYGMILRVNPRRILSGSLDIKQEENLKALPKILAEAKNKYLLLPPNKTRCVSDVETQLYDELKAGDIDVVGFDYVQDYAPSTGTFNDRRERVFAVTKEMTDFAIRWDIPVIIGAQLSRDSEFYERPSLRHLAECSGIEEGVSYVWGIVKDKVSENLYSNYVLKAKNGSKDYNIPYEFYPEQFMLRPLQRQDMSAL